MHFWKRIFLFAIGGCIYMGLELLWRGRSHGSMFLAGGLCFLLLEQLQQTRPVLPFFLRALAGAGIITMVEYAAGLIFNRNYTVWDYRSMPLNYHGHICFAFSLLWIPLAILAMLLYRFLDKKIPPI